MCKISNNIQQMNTPAPPYTDERNQLKTRNAQCQQLITWSQNNFCFSDDAVLWSDFLVYVGRLLAVGTVVVSWPTFWRIVLIRFFSRVIWSTICVRKLFYCYTWASAEWQTFGAWLPLGSLARRLQCQPDQGLWHWVEVNHSMFLSRHPIPFLNHLLKLCQWRVSELLYTTTDHTTDAISVILSGIFKVSMGAESSTVLLNTHNIFTIILPLSARNTDAYDWPIPQSFNRSI